MPEPRYEPRYADPDNPWEDDDHMAKIAETDLSDITMVPLLKRCWKVTAPGRKRFKKKAEKSRWRRVERQVSKGNIPMRWVDSCIDDWATDMNKETYVINFDKLMSAILNKAAMTDWLQENPVEGQKMVTKIDLEVDGYSG